MTAELWLVKGAVGCRECGITQPADEYGCLTLNCKGPGGWSGEQVRLNPDHLVTIRDAYFEHGEWSLPVANIIKALEEE